MEKCRSFSDKYPCDGNGCEESVKAGYCLCWEQMEQESTPSPIEPKTQESKDYTNPYNLEVGKSYWFQYTGCKSNWFHGTVTRFTKFGHPWVDASVGYLHNGIISPGLYNVESKRPSRVEDKTQENQEELFREMLDELYRLESSTKLAVLDLPRRWILTRK